MDFQGLLDHLLGEAALIQKAPLSFIVFTALGGLAGYGIAKWYYGRAIAEKDALSARYRVALGIDRASQGTLIELTNKELRAKALSTAGALRSFEIALRNETQSLVVGARDDKDRAERAFRVMRNKSDEFDRTLKADSTNVDTELRRRLGPEAVASVVGVSPSWFSASDGAPIGLPSLLPSGSGMSAPRAGVLADGIEQMARMLPAE